MSGITNNYLGKVVSILECKNLVSRTVLLFFSSNFENKIKIKNENKN
jgi:predicted deacetylase